jgi:hypothetical protein
MDNQINIYQVLNTAENRMRDIYKSTNQLFPKFQLNLENNSTCDFKFQLKYNGIFSLIKDFASVWILLRNEDRLEFCCYVVGKYYSKDLYNLMSILCDRSNIKYETI